MQRYYRLDIQPDLFGNQCLTREWGRIGRAGQMRTTFYQSMEEAEQAFIKQRTAKERKGYTMKTLEIYRTRTIYENGKPL
jgi:predicted DNA-binding WGR domain protein